MSVQITPSTSYMRLDCWVLANIIQLATMNFCRRFLNRQNDPCRRQFDQMTQAARSITANIAEGTSRHDTSIEMEMRLLDVARASNNELMGDFLFLLMDRGLDVWSENCQQWQDVYKMRLTIPHYSTDLLLNATNHVKREKLRFDHLIENEKLEIAANALLALCTRVRVILTKRLESILADFEQNGGFTENMTATRLATRTKTSKSEGAPRCPKCGAVMIKRMASKGVHSGHEFWSCSNHTTTGCMGLIDIEKTDYPVKGQTNHTYHDIPDFEPLIAAEPIVEYGNVPVIEEKSAKVKAYTMDDLRKKHSNAYKPWTEADETSLRQDFERGMSIQELMEKFGRNEGSIHSRLKKLRLME